MTASLAPADRRSENVWVHAVIVPELKLRDVQRQIFAADFVEVSDDAALEDAPKSFNRVGVNCADDVLATTVIDNAVLVSFGKARIGLVSIGAEQANFRRNGFADEIFESNMVNLPNNAGDDVALAFDRADH